MYKITIEQDFNKIMRRIQMCFIYIYAMSWPRAVLLRFFLHFFLFMYVQLQTEDWAGERATKQKLNRTETEGKEKTVVQHWPVVAANLPALNHADRPALDCPVLPPTLAHQATQQHLLWHLSVVGRVMVVVVEVVVKDLDSWFWLFFCFCFWLGTVQFGLRASEQLLETDLCKFINN